MGLTFVGYSPDITFRSDYVNLLSFNYLHPAFSFSRSSPGLFRPTGETFVLSSNNTPRWEFDAGKPSGLLIEPIFNNQILNPTGVGLVAGNPGTRPTGWAQVNVVTGVSAEWGTKVINGFIAPTLRLFGTPTVTTNWTIEFAPRSASSSAASPGQQRTAHLFTALAAGSLSNVAQVALRVLAVNSSGGVVSGSTVASPDFQSTLGGNLSQVVFPYTISSDVSTTGAVLGVRVSLTDGLPVDVTLAIYGAADGPNVPSSSPSWPPVGTIGPSTRLPDQISTTSLDDIKFNQIQGTFISRWIELGDVVHNVWRAASDSQNILDLRRSDSSNITLRKVTPSEGTTAVSVSAPYSTGRVNTVAATYAYNRLALSINGGAAVSAMGGANPIVDNLRLGSRTGPANVMNGRLQLVSYIPSAVSDTELRFLSSVV